MSIVIIRQDDKIDAWVAAIKTSAPEVSVFNFLEEHNAEDVEVALVWKHPKGSLAKYPNLKYIASSGAGVDFIFEDTTAPTHLPITRVVDAMLANDMSEHVIAVIFNYLKHLNHYKVNQINKLWQPMRYNRIADFTVGIMGVGALGTVLSKDLIRFGFKTQGWSVSKKHLEGVKTYAGQDELTSFLATTDILICLLPLTNDTKGILNKAIFNKLPQGAYVINVARGGHLVDEDLVNALDDKHLSGAALDVYHQEPLPKNHPFWLHDKIDMTPHCASVSDSQSVVPQILENYKRMKSGKSLLNLVSKSKGY